MAISNAERVGKALELLNQGLFPFMKRELKASYGDTWFEQASANLREYQMPGKGDGDEHWDTQALLLVMWDQWNVVFRNVLGQAERSLVSELREVRNKWAHQEPLVPTTPTAPSIAFNVCSVPSLLLIRPRRSSARSRSYCASALRSRPGKKYARQPSLLSRASLQEDCVPGVKLSPRTPTSP